MYFNSAIDEDAIIDGVRNNKPIDALELIRAISQSSFRDRLDVLIEEIIDCRPGATNSKKQQIQAISNRMRDALVLVEERIVSLDEDTKTTYLALGGASTSAFAIGLGMLFKGSAGATLFSIGPAGWIAAAALGGVLTCSIGNVLKKESSMTKLRLSIVNDVIDKIDSVAKEEG